MTTNELRAAWRIAEQLCDALEDMPEFSVSADALRLALYARLLDRELSEAQAWAARRPVDATRWTAPAIYDAAIGQYVALPVNPLAARVVRGWAVTREADDRYEAVQVGTGRRVRGTAADVEQAMREGEDEYTTGHAGGSGEGCDAGAVGAGRGRP